MGTEIQRKAVYACVRLCCVALALFILSLTPALAEADGMLRVKLSRLGAPSAITMRADCDYVLDADATVRVSAGADMTVTASGGRLTLSAGSRRVDLGSAACLTRDGTGKRGVTFSSPALSNRFCGDVCLAASGDAVAAMLNIYIEDYLYGVVGYEMSPSSGLEALKAQAVVARNYALRQKGERSGAGYDLTDAGDALSYRGYNDAPEYADALRAVDETRGQVVYGGDSLADCYFCDSNGGQTESAANALGRALSYSSVMDDPYDLQGGGAKRTASLRRDASDLNASLRAALLAGMAGQLQAQGLDPDGAKIVSIDAIEPESPRFDPPSRLYRSLAFTVTASGSNLLGETLTAQATVHLPTYGGLEQWYDLSINDDDNETVWVDRTEQSYEITFRRSGLGVGLSKRGAYAMARKGLSCQTILEYYYPGTALRKLSLGARAAQAVEAKPLAGETPIASARLKQRTRLYESADASGTVRTTLPAGATLAVYGVREAWAAIGSGKLYGFVHTDALTGFALAGAVAVQVQGETYAQVSGGEARLLQLPVKGASTVTTLAEGARVRLIAYTDKWAKVSAAGGAEGFMSRDSLTLQATGEASEADGFVTAQDNLYGRVTVRTDLRERPDERSASLQALAPETYVSLLAYSDAWARVRTADGAKGYVPLKALTPVQQVAVVENAAIEGGRITVVHGKQYRYVAAEAVSLFKSHSADSEILATLKRGQRVRLGAYNAVWACVRVKGVTGFVLASALAEDPPADAEDGLGGRVHVARQPFYAVVALDGAPMYPSWSAADAPITRLKQGDRVQVGAYNDVWACVKVDDLMGFVRRDALAASDATQAADADVRYVQWDAVAVAEAPMYASAALEGVPVGTVAKGQKVRVRAFNRTCAYVECGGRQGFVALESLKRSK